MIPFLQNPIKKVATNALSPPLTLALTHHRHCRIIVYKSWFTPCHFSLLFLSHFYIYSITLFNFQKRNFNHTLCFTILALIMNVLALPLLVFLAMAGYSSAAYCVCNSGVSETAMQSNIDYACGAGADCHQINPSGPCYNPNTLKDHCNFAVNSYYQKKGQTAMACSFSGTATVTSSPPSGASSACFSGSASTSTTPTNPTIAPPGSGTGTGTGNGTGTSTGTGTGTSTGTGSGTGTGINTSPSSFGGLAPSGTAGMNDSSRAATIQLTTSTMVLLTFLAMGLVWPRLI